MVWQVVVADAVDVVGHADLDRLEGVEDVELGDRHLRQRIQPHCVAQHDRVEPARPTATLGVDAVLVAQIDDPVTGLVEQLGGHRPGPDAGDVRLGDADHAVDVERTHSGTHAGATGDRVRRRDERVRPVVEVQERGLGTFEQHVLSAFERLVHERDGVRDIRGHPRRHLGEVPLGQLVGVEAEAVVDLGEDQVLLRQDGVELLPEDDRIEQVLNAQTDAGRLVGVGGADAALGGAELVLAQVAFDQPIQLLVVGQDQVGVARHPQLRAVDAARLERVDLGEHHHRVDDDAVADHRCDVVVQDPRRDQLECKRLTVDHQGVAGVVAALVADDRMHLLGDEVGELALPLVAPLGAHHDGRRHWNLLGRGTSDTTARSPRTFTRRSRTAILTPDGREVGPDPTTAQAPQA